MTPLQHHQLCFFYLGSHPCALTKSQGLCALSLAPLRSRPQALSDCSLKCRPSLGQLFGHIVNPTNLAASCSSPSEAPDSQQDGARGLQLPLAGGAWPGLSRPKPG